LKLFKCYISIVLLTIVCCSCGVKKHIPAGKKLYNGAVIKVERAVAVKDKNSYFKTKLADITSPDRNKMLFGDPYKVWWWYFIGKPKKEAGFKSWLRRKLGEEPVLDEKVNPHSNAENIQAWLENKGYFNSTAIGDTITTGYRISAVYKVKVESPYTFAKIGWRLDSSRLSKDIVRLPANESLIRPGDQYNAEKIKAEASRINAKLKQVGYYFIKTDDIIAYVDTNNSSQTVSLIYGIKTQTRPVDKIPYKINSVTVFVESSSFPKMGDTASGHFEKSDQVVVVDSAKKFRAGIFPRAIIFRSGDLYSLPAQTKTINRLNSYGVFRFIRTEFKRADTNKIKDHLDVTYYTNLQKPKKFEFELGGFFRSNSYTGVQASGGWKHKNLFRGAEVLQLKATGSLEIGVNDSLQKNNNWRLGGEASLVVPRFIAPWVMGTGFNYLPKTRILFSYDWVRRQELYTQNYTHFRYEWNWSDTITKSYTLTPISLTYYQSSNFTDSFFTQVQDDDRIYYTVPPSLIAAIGFQYQLSNATSLKRNIFNLYSAIELSGNTLGLIYGNNGYYSTKIGNAYFMQFVRTEFDFRYTRKFSKELALANRIIVGASYPYGNSPFLPFSRQFIIGGANSLRGFLPRQIGPGSTKATTQQQTVFPQVGGDYKLELNTEFRFPIAGLLKGATFIDAGNFWMKDTILYTPKGKLTKNFLSELAMDAGIGLRLDVKILVLRLDLGVPLYKPFLEPGQRWVSGDIRLGDAGWRKENFVWNLAIGYPF
jgi:outer membrane protein insertion porin family